MYSTSKTLLKELNFASIGMTWQCNAKCKACDVWKNENRDTMPAKYYAKLPQTLNEINITGGEPFLRKDLVEVINTIYTNNKQTRFVFSSNGLLTDLIINKLKEIKKIGANIGIRISIDGIGKIHEISRGIPGAFDKAMMTVEKLKQLEINDLGLAFTLADYNADQLEKVHDLANKLEIQFTFCGITHNSEVLFGENINKPLKNYKEIKKQVNLLTSKYLCSLDIKNWYRAYYTAGIYHHAKTGTRDIPCNAGKAFFYMHPNGDIFPDMVLNKKLGNLEKNSFEEIWFSNEAKKFREWISDVHNCPNQCWMVCTVAPWIRNNKFRLIPWIIKSKVKAHLNNFKIEE